MSETPRVTDNDINEITVTLDGKELRGWSYKDDAERRTKMLSAREYVEGWCEGHDSPAQTPPKECQHLYKTGGGSVSCDGSWTQYWRCSDCGATGSMSGPSVSSTEAPAQTPWTIQDDCKSLLQAIDHTLCVHGHIDAGTPLHERLDRTLSALSSTDSRGGK